QMFNVHSLNFSHWVIQMVVLLVVFTGVYEIQEKSLTIGGLIAVTILSSRVMVPIVNFSSVVARYKEFTKALETLNDFWYLPNENSGKTEVGVEKFHGNIEFDEVDYYYKKSKNPVLKNVSFKINHGEKVAFIGQTGAGKSTILKLLTGIELPTKGKVFLDSHDLDTIHNVEIRKNIGVMPQEPFLFSGTLKENIELSRSVSKEELMDVIQSTGLHNLVKKSAKGETLQVGERGSNLSVGQRHLVTLARAILSNPSILILDEPTTGLDIGLEKELIKKIKTVVEDKTLIVITHRMAALELVDRVFVVKDGQIAVSGPRDKVLAYLRNPNGGKK
ncbi:MAG: ATP-binding cassette domain-containing protein, partial [Campylobacterales bacterium]|nr:ATP-binding cassette domain-containing protein [Campylobacterales bacterium]